MFEDRTVSYSNMLNEQNNNGSRRPSREGSRIVKTHVVHRLKKDLITSQVEPPKILGCAPTGAEKFKKVRIMEEKENPLSGLGLNKRTDSISKPSQRL